MKNAGYIEHTESAENPKPEIPETLALNPKLLVKPRINAERPWTADGKLLFGTQILEDAVLLKLGLFRTEGSSGLLLRSLN